MIYVYFLASGYTMLASRREINVKPPRLEKPLLSFENIPFYGLFVS